MKQNDKKRLFEVMQRLDKTFKPKMNENYSDYLDTNYSADGMDDYHADNETQKKAEDHYDTGLKMFNAGDVDGAEKHRQEALRISSSLGWGENELPPYKSTEEIQTPITEGDEFFPITTPVGSEDDRLFTGIVNQGIDSHLEGFTKSTFDVKDGSLGKRRVFNFHTSELPILLRRLEELGTEEALQWKDDIENYDNNVNEMSANNQALRK